MGTSRRPLPDDDVEFVVFKRRVKDFFERRLQAVDFVDEKHLPGLQVSEYGGEFALDLEGWARGLLEGNAQLVRDNVRERCLAKPGRAVEQDVVHGLATGTGGLDGDRQIFLHLVLANELGQPLRPQLEFKGGIVSNGSGGDETSIQVGNVIGSGHVKAMVKRKGRGRNGSFSALRPGSRDSTKITPDAQTGPHPLIYNP